MNRLIFAGLVATFFALAMQVEIAGPAADHTGNVHANSILVGGR